MKKMLLTLLITCLLYITPNPVLGNEKDISISIHEDTINKLLDHTCFYPKYPTKWFNEQIKLGKTLDAKQQGWRIWGFNGRWEMPFDSPFYDWLLKVI